MSQTLTTDQLYDLFVTAIEGGINYWAYISYRNNDEDNFLAIVYDAEAEDRVEYQITPEVIRTGIDRLRTMTPLPRGIHTHERILLEQYDADDADLVVQLGLFNEVVFG